VTSNDGVGEGYTPPCPKCAGLNGVCYLTCPTLRLEPGWAQRAAAADLGAREDGRAVTRHGHG
jgi:hypothetical protein